MLIARAPVRLSFLGGGTDLPSYYERHGGLVISTSIDKYFYVFATPKEHGSVQINSSDYRAFFRKQRGVEPLWDDDLGLVRAALRDFGYDSGLSLFLASEVPPGSGLGSSGAVAVALVKTLATLHGYTLDREAVAARACALEIDRLGSPVGRQDQYASSFGGLNAITFGPAGMTVQRLSIDPKILAELERSLLLFFTGVTRDANDVLEEQNRASRDDDSATVAALHAMKALAIAGLQTLERGNLQEFAALIAESWAQKKRLATGVSNERVDTAYELALRHGALGGKLAGAGGGGFLILYCEPPRQRAVTEALESAGLRRMEYRFERAGAQVLMNAVAQPLLTPPPAEWVDA